MSMGSQRIGHNRLTFTLFILSLAVVGLCCSVWASNCGGFSLDLVTPGAETSVAAAHGLSCTTACRIFLDQGSNQCPCIQGRFLTTGQPEKPFQLFLILEFPSDFFFHGLQAPGKILHLVVCFSNVPTIII